MGMYTEFIFGASLKGLPEYVVEAIDAVINRDDCTDGTSKEAMDFIDEYELGRLFHGSSYYFGAHCNKPTFVWDKIGEHWVLSTRANCKNYKGQIEKFIKFITPYVEDGSGDYHGIIAYVQYELAEYPTLYDKHGERHDWYDRNKVSKAEENLNKIEDAYWDLINDAIKGYQITDDTLKERGLTHDTFTHYDATVFCLEEMKRRWNQTYDENYKQLQEELDLTKKTLFEFTIQNEWTEHELKRYKEKYGEL
jgi:hypothetical protein